MRCFIRVDTGFGRFGEPEGFEFLSLEKARQAAIARGRDLLLRQFKELGCLERTFFVEVCGSNGQLISMLTLWSLLFGDAISEPHAPLCKAIPYPALRLNRGLVIEGANLLYLIATRKHKDAIVGREIFEAFPDNPSAPQADGVKNLSASLFHVIATGNVHKMDAPQRYDIQWRNGFWEECHWRPINVPVLDHNGEITSIIHHVEAVLR